MTTTVILIVALVAVGLFFGLRRTGGAGAADGTLDKIPVGATTVIRPGARSCKAVQKFAGRRFKKGTGPNLPLPDCTMSQACQCRYRLSGDRRSGIDRRSGEDKRETIRFDLEAEPRRKDEGRRKVDKMWHGD